MASSQRSEQALSPSEIVFPIFKKMFREIMPNIFCLTSKITWSCRKIVYSSRSCRNKKRTRKRKCIHLFVAGTFISSYIADNLIKKECEFNGISLSAGRCFCYANELWPSRVSRTTGGTLSTRRFERKSPKNMPGKEPQPNRARKTRLTHSHTTEKRAHRCPKLTPTQVWQENLALLLLLGEPLSSFPKTTF